MQVQVQIAGMPLLLVCDIYNGGRVAFVRTAEFKTIFCFENGETPAATFDDEGFSIGGEDFVYNTLYSYKEIPVMLAWLKRQNLQNPLIQ